jgi:hypothetical protein
VDEAHPVSRLRRIAGLAAAGKPLGACLRRMWPSTSGDCGGTIRPKSAAPMGSRLGGR